MRPTIKAVKELFGETPVRGAEIGVYCGENAGHIMSHLNIDKLHLVDCWVPTEDYTIAEGVQNNYNNVVRLFGTDPKVNIIRAYSVDASKFIPDKSLHFVYIDAEHRYHGIKADIDAWLPKVMDGGIIGGHDYDYPIRPGVKEAVDEVFGENVCTDPDQNDWYVML